MVGDVEVCLDVVGLAFVGRACVECEASLIFFIEVLGILIFTIDSVVVSGTNVVEGISVVVVVDDDVVVGFVVVFGRSLL